jgi:hypothetical protein
MTGFIDTYTSTQFGITGNYRAIAIIYTFQLTVAHALGFSVFTSRILATDLPQELSLQISMKSSCHFLFKPIGIPTLQNSTLVLQCYFSNLLQSESESGSELFYDWRFIASQFVLATSPLKLTTRFFFSTEHLRS